MRKLLLASSAFALLAWPAAGDQVEVQVETAVRYDSNSRTGGGTGGSSGSAESDYQFIGTPRFTVRSDPASSKLNYRVSYEPQYQYYVRDEANRGFEHLLDGSVSYALTKRTTVSAAGRYTRTLQLLRPTEDELELVLPDTPEEPVRQTDNTEQWNLSTSVNHSFDARWRGNVTLSIGERDFPSERQSDSEYWRAIGSLNYVQSLRSTVGVGLAVSDQELKATPDQGGTTTRSYNLFGSWTYRFTPNLTLTAQAGPAFIDPEDLDAAQDQSFAQLVVPFRRGSGATAGQIFVLDANTCPMEGTFLYFEPTLCETFPDPVNGTTGATLQNQHLLNPAIIAILPAFGLTPADVDNNQIATLFGSAVPDRQESTTTYFADIGVTQRWKRATGTFRYVRSDSGSLGGGTTTIVDRLLFQLRWQPKERWTLRFTGSWSRRRSAAEDTPQLVTLVRATMPSGSGDLTEGCFPVGSPFCIPDIAGVGMSAFLPAGTLVNTGEFGFIEIDRSTDVTSYGLAMAVNYDFTERLLGRLRLVYRKQESDSNFGTVRDFDGYIVEFGLRYTFEPFRF